MIQSHEMLKQRIRLRIRVALGLLILLTFLISNGYFYVQWQQEKQRAELLARLDLSQITNDEYSAEARLQVLSLVTEAAESNPYGLFADALQQFEQFENAMLAEQQMFLARDTPAGMALISGGHFLFGGFGRFHSAPLDTELVGFYIDKYPVTNEEFCQFLNDSGNRTEGGAWWYRHKTGHIDSTPNGFRVEADFADHPAVSVTWFGARAYARSVGKRLPTEYEWEKAARGIYGRIYPWGNIFDRARANTADYWAKQDITAENREEWLASGGRRIVDTTPIRQFPQGVSPYGCFEMCGNVWEWTSTRYQRLFRKAPRYVNRGGAFSYGRDQVQTAHRGRGQPAVTGSIVGFRCAKDVIVRGK